MLVSPFTFYRGAAYLMAADLAGSPRTGLYTQLCGDAHLSNFGAFAAPDRRLAFDVNDFDETLPGPFEWDLKRLVASFAVAGRDLGFDPKQRRGANLAVTRAYREAIRKLATLNTLDLWYSRIDVDAIFAQFQSRASAKRRKLMDKNVAKTRAKDSLRAFDKLTTMVDGEPRIISDPPLIVPIEELAGGAQQHEIEEFARGVLRSYRRTLSGDRRHLLERFHYVDMARKVVGVGSVGTRAWIVLMPGHDTGDPLFLQLKEASPRCWGRFWQEPLLEPRPARRGGPAPDAGRQRHHAGLAEGGRHRRQERDFYVRQLWDRKGSVNIEGILRPSWPPTPRSAGGAGARDTRAPAMPWRSPATWAPATCSTGRWPTSRALRGAERARLRRDDRRRPGRTHHRADRAVAHWASGPPRWRPQVQAAAAPVALVLLERSGAGETVVLLRSRPGSS